MKNLNLKKTISPKVKAYIYILSFTFLILLSFYYFYPFIKEINLNPQSLESFKLWIESQGLLGAIVVFLLQILQVVVSIIPGGPIQIIFGLIYGAIPGFLISFVGMFIGSILVYSITKLFRHKVINVFVKEEQLNKYQFLNDSPKLESILFILFLIPGVPKDTLVYYAGITNIPFKKFILITVFARIPGMLSSTFIGSSLGIGNISLSLVVFGITILFGALGFMYNKKLVNGVK